MIMNDSAGVVDPWLQQAVDAKERGNELFAERQLEAAIASYQSGLSSISHIVGEDSTSQERMVDRMTVEVALRSNLALVLHLLERHAEAEAECTKALERQHHLLGKDDPNAAYSYKVWYRRALAREAMARSIEGEITNHAGALQQQLRLLHSAESDLKLSVAQLQNTSIHTTSQSNDESSVSSSADRKALVRAQTALIRIQSQIQTSSITNPVDPIHTSQDHPHHQQTQDEPMDGLLGGGKESMTNHEAVDPLSPPIVTRLDAPKAFVNGGAKEMTASNRTADSSNCDPTTVRGVETKNHTINTPTPERQRQDIIRLLMARQNAAYDELTGRKKKKYTQSPVGARRSGGVARPPIALDGEAYFILSVDWWSSWCRWVDFFYISSSSKGSKRSVPIDTSKPDSWGTRQLSILRLLPPGASLPPKLAKDPKRKKKASSIDDDDSSSSSSDSDSDMDNDVLPPGPIDNSALLYFTSSTEEYSSENADHHDYVFYKEWRQIVNREDSSVKLRPNRIRGYHYEVLPREVYKALRVWYGEVTPTICRRASQVNHADSHPIGLLLYPELYPSNNVSNEDEQGLKDNTVVPSQQPIVKKGVKVEEQVCGACRTSGATSRCTRCHAMYYCGRGCQASHWQYHKPICQKASLVMKKSESQATNTNSNGTSDRNKNLAPLVKTMVPDNVNWGRVGLNNLGNTCFMNSAIQCLSHAAPLTKHFLTNRFKSDLNTTNPLGTGGKLATAYDAVLKEIWMGGHKHSNMSPTVLKRAIAMFAPRFAGTSQHDAQEFLAYLLDGLHEDLNRIRRAPYVEMPDVTDGQNVAIAGAEAWNVHRMRNDSHVMDTFYGQFKSTCVCPKCDKVSISFDSFNHVSLEIPQPMANQTRTIPILFFPVMKGDTPDEHDNITTATIRFGVTVDRTACVNDLKLAMSKLSGIPVTRLVICDVYQHGIYQILPDAKNVSEIRPEDVTAAYEVDPYTSTTIHAVTGHCYISDRSEMAFDDENAAEMYSGKTLFGQPFITSFPHDLTCRQVWDHIWWQVRRMVLPLLSRMEDSSTGSPNEDTLKSMLQIRFVDQNGNPRSIVKPKGMDESIRNDMAELSLLPRESNESIISFLGSDCTERFLFLSLEWSDDIPNCNGPKLEFDEFMTMADHGSFIDAVNRIKSLKSKTGVTLDDCFQTFTRPERLDEDNMWYCSNCKEHVRAMKTMELWQLPNVLILHLKRFEFKHALRRDKLETFVDSPLSDLDMTKYCASYHHAAQDNDFVVDQVPAMYDLFGVTNHYGRMGFGHYTAHARRWSEDDICHEWATFDDSSVHSAGDGTMSNNQVVTPAAYILFYRRRIFS